MIPDNPTSAFKVVPRHFQEEGKSYQFTLGSVIRHPVFFSCHEILGDAICWDTRAEGSRKSHCCGERKTRVIRSVLLHCSVIWDGQVTPARRIFQTILPDSCQPSPGRGQRYLSSIIFTLIVNHTHILGFPPPDNAVRELLTKSDGSGESIAYTRSLHFLVALFERTASALTKDLKEANGRSERITKFREFMTDGQTMADVGEKRQRFYNEIVDDVEASRVYRFDFIFLHFTEDE